MGDERTLYPQIQQDDPERQPDQREPCLEQDPGQHHQQGAHQHHGSRPPPVGHPSRQRGSHHARHADHPEQTGDLSPEPVGGIGEVEGQHSPESTEGGKQQGLG